MRAFTPAVLALIAAAVLLSPSCPEPDPVLENDAGDAAWIQRTTLMIWGRRPASTRETAVLASLVEQSDRAAVARAMTESPEYIERWQDFFYDALAVHRVGTRTRPLCWDRESLGEATSELAEYIRDAAARDADEFPVPFTMSDVTRSALVLDNLSVLYRAALFPPLTTWFEPPNLLEAAAERRMMAESFVSTHLDRNLECLPCHNSEASVTDAGDEDVDRSWPLPGHVEAALFGVSEGRPIDDLALYFRRRGVVFDFGFGFGPAPNRSFDDVNLNGCSSAPDRPGCLGCGCEEAVCAADPSCCTDGWTEACAERCIDSGEPCEAPLPAGFDGCGAVIGGQGGCDGCDCEEAVCEDDPNCCENLWDEFCAASCREQEPECLWYREQHLEDTLTPWGMNANCGIFVRPELMEDDISGDSGFFIRDDGGTASIYEIEAALAAGAERVQTGLRVNDDGSVNGDAAFAWLVGAGLADRVWKEAFGRRLTLSHHVSRNADQRDRLMHYTTALVRGGFSLRSLLVEVVTDPLFNQAAPAEALARSAYYVSPVFDPWTIEEDDEAVRPNSLADGLHPLSPRVRLRAAYTALEWTPGPEFSELETDFHPLAQAGIGVFLKESEPGFDAQGLQPTLTWEHLLGACRDPGNPPETESDPNDWIAALVAEVERRGATGTNTSWEQAVATVKDRIVGEGWLSEGERAATETLLGFTLADRMTGTPDADVPLRRVCGALLSSPQFLLSGLSSLEPPEDPPVLVPVPGTRFQEHCTDLSAAMYPDGDLDCSTGAAVLR